MTLETVLLILILLAALGAALGAWRARPENPKPLEDVRRQLTEEVVRTRRDGQADLAAQLQPLQAQVAQVASAVVTAKAEQEAALLGRFQEVQGQLALGLQAGREELGAALQALRGALDAGLAQARQEQGQRLEALQAQVQERLGAMQTSNEAKLEQMRATVDEKLHATLELRLGESFKLVSERLELVQRGLGEMQSLAQDVGGLKRALTNVKTRGVLGEYQLGQLLDQFLAPQQYAANVKVRPRSPEVVEYAVKLPGPDEEGPVWLPIDAKFPIEDYQRLMEAYELGDGEGIARAAQALEVRLMGQGRDIRDKYIAPPHTTDFALLFLPFEGLYAEALRRPGLLERLQRECKVTLVGPTTLTAFLNSLQVGFKTLAISRQTSEVWKVLGAVKAEFGTFGKALEAVNAKLEEASKKLGEVGRRSDLMQKKLAKVETLPEGEAQATLALDQASLALEE